MAVALLSRVQPENSSIKFDKNRDYASVGSPEGGNHIKDCARRFFDGQFRAGWPLSARDDYPERSWRLDEGVSGLWKPTKGRNFNPHETWISHVTPIKPIRYGVQRIHGERMNFDQHPRGAGRPSFDISRGFLRWRQEMQKRAGRFCLCPTGGVSRGW